MADLTNENENTRKTEDPSLAAEESSNPSDINTRQLSQNPLRLAKVFKLTDGVRQTFEYSPFTDRGNASRLASFVRTRFRYVSNRKQFIFYDGSRWVEGDDIVMRAAILCMDRFKSFADQKLDAEEMQNFAQTSQSEARLRSAVSLLKHEQDMLLDSSKLDSERFLLNVANGTVDLKTGQFRPPSKDDYITEIAPVIYDANAQCPLFNRFLSEVTLHDRELQNYLHRVFGYVFSGDISEQCLFFLYGGGQNGKSVLLNLMRYLSGSYCRRTGASTLMKSLSSGSSASPDLARLQSARIVLASELDEGHTFSESLIKDMTGGEAIVARHLYKGFEEFEPKFKLIFGGNHKPKISGTDDGIWRRFHLIPFLYKVPEDKKDPKIEEKLKSEASGILNWIIEGCLEWQRGGLNPPEIVNTAVAEYRKESSRPLKK